MLAKASLAFCVVISTAGFDAHPAEESGKMADYKRFDVQVDGDALILHLADPRLYETLLVHELEDELLDVIDQRQPKTLIVNFARVTHCSTSVINGLLRCKKRLAANNGTVKLCGMRDTVREAYRILNLEGTVFDIYSDVKAAQNALAATKGV